MGYRVVSATVAETRYRGCIEALCQFILCLIGSSQLLGVICEICTPLRCLRHITPSRDSKTPVGTTTDVCIYTSHGWWYRVLNTVNSQQDYPELGPNIYHDEANQQHVASSTPKGNLAGRRSKSDLSGSRSTLSMAGCVMPKTEIPAHTCKTHSHSG